MSNRWCLITVDLDVTAHLDLTPDQTGIYHVIFITRHPDDKRKQDDEAIRWLDWQ